MQQSQQDPQLSPQQKKLISYTVKDIVVEEAPCFPIKQVTLSIKNNHDNQYQAKDFSYLLKPLNNDKKNYW
jgi:hemolysin activation/secretion protein